MDKVQVNIKKLQKAACWEAAWYQAQQESIFRRNDKNTVLYWNKRAANFSKNTTGKQGEKRVKKILGWLKQEGVELSGASILDIGAGPGSFAIPMAKVAKEVVAIEPSDQMVGLMQGYAKAENLDNLQVIKEQWDKTFDINKKGFNDRFDLVFSSMNPGVADWPTLEKVLQCAAKNCYISTFAGKRDNPALKELWRQIYQEHMPPWPGDIFYITNLLYTKGYQFSFKVWEETNAEEMTVEEAAIFLADMLGRFGAKSPDEVWQATLEYVKSKEVNGVLIQDITTRLGKILVRLS